MAALELIVIDRALGSQDESASLEEQADKILYFKCPQDGVSINQQLSMLTMVEGLIEFTSKFSNKSIETALLDRKVWCFHECEPDTWLVASFPMQSTAPCNPKGLHGSLVQLYDCYRLLFGRIHDQVNMSHFDNLQKMRKKVRKAQAAIYLQSQDFNLTEDVINDVFDGKDYACLPAALAALFDDYFDLKDSLRKWLVSPLHTLPALRTRLSAFMTWYSYYGTASDGTFLSALPKSLNPHQTGPCRAALVHRIQRVLQHQLGDLLLGCAVYHDGGLLWSDFDDVLTSSLSHFLQLLDISHLLALRDLSDECLSGGLWSSPSQAAPSSSSSSSSSPYTTATPPAPPSSTPSAASSSTPPPPPAFLYRSGSVGRVDDNDEARRDAKLRLVQDLLADRLGRSGVALTSWQALALDDATVDVYASEGDGPRPGSGKHRLAAPLCSVILDGVRTADGRDSIAFPLLHTWTGDSVEPVGRALCFLHGRLVVVVGLHAPRVQAYQQAAIQRTLSLYTQDRSHTLVPLSQFVQEMHKPTVSVAAGPDREAEQAGQAVGDAGLDEERVLSVQVTLLAQRVQRALHIDVVRPFRKLAASSLEPLLPHGSPSPSHSLHATVSSVSLSSTSGSVSGREGAASLAVGGYGAGPVYTSTPPFPRMASTRRVSTGTSPSYLSPAPPPPLPPSSSSGPLSGPPAGSTANSAASAFAVIVSAREVAIGHLSRATNTLRVLSARDVLELILTGGEAGSGGVGAGFGHSSSSGGGGGGGVGAGSGSGLGGGSSGSGSGGIPGGGGLGVGGIPGGGIPGGGGGGGGAKGGVDLLDWLVKKYSQLRSPPALYFPLVCSLFGRTGWRCLNAVWAEMGSPRQQAVVQRVSTAQRGGLWAVGLKLHMDLHATLAGEKAPEVVVVAMVRACATVHELHDLTELLAGEVRRLLI